MISSTDQITPVYYYNISFIIHYRRDSDDRFNNFKFSVDYIAKNFTGSQIIVINDSPEIDKEIITICKTNGVNLLICENHDEFKKTYCFNSAAAVAVHDIFCFWDVDIIISEKYIRKAYEYILNGTHNHVYPFNGTFIDLQKDVFDPYVLNYDFDGLEKLWQEKHPSLHLASSESPGGCNLISKQAFEKMGGYDVRFIGWGFEDTDFLYRSRKLNSVIYLQESEAICWHMHHDNAIRTENPYYNYNLLIFNQNNQ